jgi:hypothetical protein
MIPIIVSAIFGEDPRNYTYGIPHRYEIRTMPEKGTNYKILGDIHFQEGPYEEGINGITEMDLIAIIIARLKKIQETEEVNVENAQSIIFLEEALSWQRKKYGLKVIRPKEAEKEGKKDNGRKGNENKRAVGGKAGSRSRKKE